MMAPEPAKMFRDLPHATLRCHSPSGADGVIASDRSSVVESAHHTRGTGMQPEVPPQ